MEPRKCINLPGGRKGKRGGEDRSLTERGPARCRVGNGFFAVAHAVRSCIDSVGKIAGITCKYLSLIHISEPTRPY